MLDALVLPEGLGKDAEAQRHAPPSWGRRIGTFVLWAVLQTVFIALPPLVALPFNVALVVGFVWWFVLRRDAGARRRMIVFRLHRITPAVARRLPFVAVPLVGLVLASMIVVPRVIPFPPPSNDLLEQYMRRPYAVFAVLVLVSLLAPLVEEFLFRGWLQGSLEKRIAPSRAIVITALAFAAAHGQLFGLPIRFAFGLVAGYAAWSTGSIWPGVLLHGLYNASLILVGSATPGVDEHVLTRWAHTPAVFWPAAAGLLVSGLLLVAALARLAPERRRRSPVHGVD